jgi:hypothetical protein
MRRIENPHVGWIRLLPAAKGLPRRWKRVTRPLPLEHVLDILASYKGGDGGKVALPEGEHPLFEDS